MANGYIVLKEDIVEKIGRNIGEGGQGNIVYPGAYEYAKEFFSANKICVIPKLVLYLDSEIALELGPHSAFISYKEERGYYIESPFISIGVDSEHPNKFFFAIIYGG